jgi:hypothetical protein
VLIGSTSAPQKGAAARLQPLDLRLQESGPPTRHRERRRAGRLEPPPSLEIPRNDFQRPGYYLVALKANRPASRYRAESALRSRCRAYWVSG